MVNVICLMWLCFILHWHPSLSIAALAAGIFTAFGVEFGSCTVVVRHGNVTSVCDVVLVSLFPYSL